MFPLQNNWVICYNDSVKLVKLFSAILPINSSTINLDFATYWNNSPTEDDTRKYSNVFYWITKMHNNYWNNKLGFYGLDYQMQIIITNGSDNNAGANYGAVSITFGKQNYVDWGLCKNVICHEYSHCAIFHIYGNFIRLCTPGVFDIKAAMDEGLADYFALSYNNNGSVIGADLPQGYGYQRDLNNTNTYRTDMNAYYNGTVIGGACWDLRSIGGQKYSDPVVLAALQVTPHAYNFSDFYYNVSVANDLIGGGFSSDQLQWAFYTRHGITMGSPSLSKKNANQQINHIIESVIPSDTKLEQNFPNPFNPKTDISISLSKKSFVTLEIFDILGKRVTNLENKILEAGYYTYSWNANDLPSGIYLYKFNANNNIQVKKMFLMK